VRSPVAKGNLFDREEEEKEREKKKERKKAGTTPSVEKD